METSREAVTLPLWGSDALDAPVPPHFEAPYFDEALDAWVVVRHDDVLTALRSAELSVHGATEATQEEEATRSSMRMQTLAALSGDQLRIWTERLRPLAERRVEGLGESEIVSLIEDYLNPACLDLAAIVTDIAREDAKRLRDVAKPVSAAAAEPRNPRLKELAKRALPELQDSFHSETETLRESGFVALAHTLPALLANACYALIGHPAQWALLHRDGVQIERAVEELMRYAGLTRVLRRRAKADVVLGGITICRGDSLILRVFAANHDPTRFCKAATLDIQRDGGGHLTFGAGAHSCVGAGLLRMASVVILRPLFETFGSATLVEPVTWHGGSGFYTPLRLRVRLLKGPSIVGGSTQ